MSKSLIRIFFLLISVFAAGSAIAKTDFPIEFQFCLPQMCSLYSPVKPLDAEFKNQIKKTEPNCLDLNKGILEYFKRPSVQKDLEIFNIKKTFLRAELTLRQNNEGKCDITFKGYLKSGSFKQIGKKRQYDPLDEKLNPRKIATDLVNQLQDASAAGATK